jgi:hypothetical protein
MVLEVICGVLALLGVLFGLRCYVELWRWAKQCQGARILVATSGKVQINAPLVDWLGWANQLEADEAVKGRVVYLNGKVKVAILKRPIPPHRSAILIAKAIHRVGRLRDRGTRAVAT